MAQAQMVNQTSPHPHFLPHFRYHELQSAHMAQAQMVNQSESGRAAPYMNTIKTQEQVCGECGPWCVWRGG